MKKFITTLALAIILFPQLTQAAGNYNFNKQLSAKQIELAKNKKLVNNKKVIEFGAVSHHLPTAVSLITDFYQRLSLSQGNRQLFFIIGPDHREACLKKIVTTNKNYQTSFGVVEIADSAREFLNKAGITSDPFCFYGEHAMGVQAIMISYFFPRAEIVPILISSSAKEVDINNLVTALSFYLGRASFIASVDYSHYLTQVEADKIDKKTIELITRSKFDLLRLANVDSPASVKVLARLANLNKSKKILMASHGNSAQFTGQKQSTTSYINFFMLK